VELNRLQRQLKHTFVHVTHDQEEAMALADRMCIMKAGRVEQVGTPLEVYNAPYDRYVARQLGSPPINFVAGRLDAGGRFTADEMSLSARAASDHGSGGPAWLGVRPEDIGIVRSPAGPGRVPATIYEVEPLGAITIIDVRVGEHIFKAQLTGQPSFAEGEPVHLEFDLAKCHVFDGPSEKRLTTGLIV
jgi:multiple sugar transport system ATP-binding protein